MALDKKQKILVPIIVIAVIYVAWQLWSMFGGGSGSAPSAAPQSQPKAAAVNAAPSGGNSAGQTSAGATMGSSAQSAAAPAATASTGAAAMQPSSMPQAQAAVVAQPALTPVQAQYLDLSNQYQIARMQRMLLDQQAAIAQAKEKILKLDQSLRGSGVSIGQDLSSSVYRLVYIGYQAGSWRAAINFSGRFFVVRIGDTLPNGATVSRISNAGVVLDIEGEQILLTTLGNHTIKQQSAQPAVANAQGSANSGSNSTSQQILSLQQSLNDQNSNVNQPSMPSSHVTSMPSQAAAKPVMLSNDENLMAKSEPKPVMPVAKPVEAEKTPANVAVETIAKVPAAVSTTENNAGSKVASSAETAAAKPVEVEKTPANVTAETASKPLTIAVPNKAAAPSKPEQTIEVAPAVKPSSEKPTAQPLPSLQKIDVDMSPAPPRSQDSGAVQPNQHPVKIASVNTATQKTKATTQQVPLTAHEEKTFKDLKQFIKSENHQVQQKAVSSETKSMAKTNAVLLKVPGNHYTIQLMGGRSQSALRQLIAANHLNQAHVFRTFYLGKEWFVLIDGNYKTADQARQALGQLPDNLKRLNPWVRPMSSVHQAIKLYH